MGIKFVILNRDVQFFSPQCLGSGSAKICGSTDPDPRGKISTQKLAKKNFFSLKPQDWTVEKKIISWSMNGSSSLSERRRKIIWQFCFVKKIGN